MDPEQPQVMYGRYYYGQEAIIRNDDANIQLHRTETSIHIRDAQPFDSFGSRRIHAIGLESVSVSHNNGVLGPSIGNFQGYGRVNNSSSLSGPSRHEFIRRVDSYKTLQAFPHFQSFKSFVNASHVIDNLGFHSSEGTNSVHSNHEYTTTSVVNYLACYNEMKVQARTSGKMPNIVYDEVMAKYEGMFEQILTFPSVQSTLLKCRKEYFPRFRQPAAEFFAAFEQQSVFLRYGHCFDDLFFHGVVGNEADGRCGIFYTQRLLAYFDSIKDEIKAFADATFKYQPLYFHQLFIVHFEIGNYVRHVFMERKTTAAYQCIFEVIKNLGFNIVELMADFEKAIKLGFLAIYPEGTVFGCHFHLAQALLRRMKKMKRMKVDFNLLRILSSLAFLPPDEIIPTFRKIKTKYGKPSNRSFFKYFENFWIKEIGPAGFSIYGRDQITNNVAESFHSLIKNFIGVLANATASSKLWELLDQLIKIHHKMEMQLSTYSKKSFMGLIRTKSKKRSQICKNRLNARYSRMRDNNVDFDGLHLVESIHDDKFVKYVEELENERLKNNSDEELSSEDEADEVNLVSENMCAVCKSESPNFIYDECSHLNQMI